WTLVAASGPSLISLSVKWIVSPTFGVGLSTDLARTRSAFCGVSRAPALLLPVFGSNWSAPLIVAVLKVGFWLATLAWSVRVVVAPLATIPTVHAPVAELYIPWAGVALTKVRLDGNRSCTVTLLAASGP